MQAALDRGDGVRFSWLQELDGDHGRVVTPGRLVAGCPQRLPLRSEVLVRSGDAGPAVDANPFQERLDPAT